MQLALSQVPGPTLQPCSQQGCASEIDLYRERQVVEQAETHHKSSRRVLQLARVAMRHHSPCP